MTVIIKWDGNTSTITKDMILGTRMVSGKNQPFGAVDIILDRYIFSPEKIDEDGQGDGKWQNDETEDGYNPYPKITVGKTRVSVDTFGTVEDYIISNISTDEDYTILTAHHPAYNLTHTHFNSLFLDTFTIRHIYSDHAVFKANLPGITEDVRIPSDHYRANKDVGDKEGMGCQNKYTDTFTEGIPTSEYNNSTLTDISKYTSGVGYFGRNPEYANIAKKKYTYWYNYQDINLIFHINIEKIGDENVRSIEWIEGESEDIVRFILVKGIAEDVYPQIISPAMTYYPDPRTEDVTLDVELDYSEDLLNMAIEKGLTPLNSTDDIYGTPIGLGGSSSTNRLRLRIAGAPTCKSILDSISSLTNRRYHFSSEGFFFTNNMPAGPKGTEPTNAIKYDIKDGAFVKETVRINDTKCVYLDFDVGKNYDPEGMNVKPEVVYKAPDIQDNTDAVVISAQTVYSENYGVKVINRDALNMKEGGKILLPLIDMSDGETEGLNRYRNRMTRLCAYNELVNKYRYETSISYDTSEMDVSELTGTTIVYDYDDFLRETGQLRDDEGFPIPPQGVLVEEEGGDSYYRGYNVGETVLYDGVLVLEKVRKTGTEVVLDDNENPLKYTDGTEVMIDTWEDTELYTSSEELKYNSDSFTALLIDNFNGLEIYNVPLAFLIRTYPEHMTILAWGKSHTNDLPEQIRQQQEDIMVSGAPGDEDLEISDKYSSRLVVGNLTQSQLSEQDDRKTGFTGLTMEKNIGSDLYRLAGYNNGIVQAKFDTDGRIVAGEDKTTLDGDGLTVLFDGLYDDINRDYQPQSALKFQCMQNPGWESATLYSSMLNVKIPGESAEANIEKQNLTALTLSDGLLYEDDGDDKRIKSNLLLSTSGAHYGDSVTTSNYIDTLNVPHCFKLEYSDADELYYGKDGISNKLFGEDVPLDAEYIYTGVPSGIIPYIDTDGINASQGASGVVVGFKLYLSRHSSSYAGTVRLNNISYTMGNQRFGIDFEGNIYQGGQYVYVRQVVSGVVMCDGPKDVDLSYNYSHIQPPLAPYYAGASIDSWRVGVYGHVTAIELGIDSGVMGNIRVTEDRWGAPMGRMDVGIPVNVTHNSDKPIRIQPRLGNSNYTKFTVNKGATYFYNPSVSGNYDGRCAISYSISENKSLYSALNPSTNKEGKVTFSTSVETNKGSMVFLRNDGAYIFGNLNIAGGENANVSFKAEGIDVGSSVISFGKGYNRAILGGRANLSNMEFMGEAKLNNIMFTGNYTSDGYPEASALKQIGSMMRISKNTNISKDSVYWNTTDYPIYVMFTHHHHWTKIHIRNPNSVRTLIYETDGDGGIGGRNGKSSVSFFVPPGWGWDCAECEGHKYATTFYFVESGM